MSFSAAALGAVLERHLPPGASGLLVALSGGPDSCCLLAAAAQRYPRGSALPLRAVHVDHGLQSAAGTFRAVCTSLCDRLRVPLSIIEVAAVAPAGASLEAAARDARYAALAAALAAGECLLTAHHCEDQAETLLLQALRGAGLKGLASMPALRPFAAGWHLRPMLEVTRGDIERFAADHGIVGALDPMNEDSRFDRVYLRRQVWPLIARRWPGAAKAISRVAAHAAQAQELLESTADEDLAMLADGEALSVPRLRALGPARRINAVRRWIDRAAAEPPPAARLSEALRQIMDADRDHLPAVPWGAHALRRYRDRLFLTAAQPPDLGAEHAWAPALQSVLDLGPGLGRLHCVAQLGGLAADRLPARLQVRGRRGGETLRPGADAATQSVQHLCQAHGILPWMRSALPLIFAGADLIAVGDLWLDARWRVAARESGLAFRWEQAPQLV